MSNMNDFASELARELQRYTNVVEEELRTAQEEVADVAVSKLRQSGPKKQVLIVKGGVRRKKVIVLLSTIPKDN